MEEPLEATTRSEEGWAVLLDIRQSSEEALKGAGALERRNETAVNSDGCRGRAGRRSHGDARKGLGRFAGVLVMLEGGFEAAAEDQSTRGARRQLWLVCRRRGRRPERQVNLELGGTKPTPIYLESKMEVNGL